MRVLASVSICCSPPLRLPPRRPASVPSIGKQRLHALQGPRRVPGSSRTPTDLEVLPDREVREDAPVLRHVSDAGSRDQIRRKSHKIRAVEDHVPGARGCDPHDRLQRGRLPGAVPTEERHDLAPVGTQAHAEEDPAHPVPGVQVRQFEHHPGCRSGPESPDTSQIHALDLGIRPDLRRAPVGQHAAVVHHQNSARRPEDHVHVMFREEHRQPARAHDRWSPDA